MSSNTNQFNAFKTNCLKEVEEIKKKYGILVVDNEKLKSENLNLLDDKIKLLSEYDYLMSKINKIEESVSITDITNLTDRVIEYRDKYELIIKDYNKLDKTYNDICSDYTKVVRERDNLLDNISDQVQKVRHYGSILSQYKLLVKETDYMVKDSKRHRDKFLRDYTRLLIEFDAHHLLRRTLDITDRNSWVDYGDILGITRQLITDLNEKDNGGELNKIKMSIDAKETNSNNLDLD